MEELKNKIINLNQDEFNEIKQFVLESSEPQWFVELIYFLSDFFGSIDDTAHYNIELQNIIRDWKRKEINWQNGIGE